ncbi:predicted flavoproteins [Firmicutes bacterium CAG:882]|nr:predicted flavoproteins [Firmicutes bacterium CAG:882]
MKYDVAVIGAGASGMMAAIQAAKSGRSVAVLEILARPGKKILVTGNGKCNLTNYKLDGSCYHTDSGSTEDIMGVIERFDSKAVTEFFREEGMLVRDRDGYVYPYSEQAASVLDCLRQCLVRYGVELICGCEIASVKKSGNEFIVSGMIRDVEAENRRADAKKDGSKKKAKDKASANDVAAMRKFSCISDKLIVATGSAAGGVCNQGMERKGVEAAEPNCELGYNIARGFGHHIVKLLPALVSLVCSEGFFKEISGVRAKGSVRLIIDGECAASDRGELQLTDNGISGIPVFQVSRYAVAALDSGKKRVQAELDFMLEYGEKELSEYIDKLKSDMKRIHGGSSYDNEAALTETLTGLVNRKLMGLFIRLSGGRTAELVKLLKHFTVEVVDFKGTQSAQVCSGGVRLDEIDIANMESKLCHGLYFCGEVLDVDGCCGGYNLQWAWSSGYAAGQS